MKGISMIISIVVPIYGVEKYLKQCVDSILGQSYSDIDVILVDDGSKDGSPQICDEYARNDNRVNVIHKLNGGLVSARKEGVKNAKGEYLLFVDGDDWIEKDMVYELVKVAKDYSPDIIESGFYYAMENEKYEKYPYFTSQLYTYESIQETIIPKMLFTGEYYKYGVYPNVWNKMYKTEILKPTMEIIPDCLTLGEDAALTYSVLFNVRSFYTIDKCLYNYRMNPSSMTKKYNDTQTANTISLIVFLHDYFVKQKSKSALRQLPYYQMAILNSNINNFAKGGINKHYFSRYKLLKEYVYKTDLIKKLKYVECTLLKGNAKVTYFCVKYRLFFPLVTFYALFKFKR